MPSPRSITRIASDGTIGGESQTDENVVETPAKRKRGRPRKLIQDNDVDVDADAESQTKTPAKKRRGRPKKIKTEDKTEVKTKATKGSSNNNNKDDEAEETKQMQRQSNKDERSSHDAVEKESDKKKSKKRKAPDHQRQTDRDETPKLWYPEENKQSYTFRVASWNVAGLRALMRNQPRALANLVKEHDLDVLCLQETKLQESHLDDPKLKIRGHLLEDEGYDAYYSCSVARKGYAGTAVFIKRRGKKKQKTMDSFFGGEKDESEGMEDTPVDINLLVPKEVTSKIGKDVHDQEGRVITVDFPLFSMTNVYVPNSGQKLERLDYRTEQWDKDFLAFMHAQQDKNPTFWVGDLNVAHTSLEVWNDGAKHLPKQAGVTPQERASFQRMLDSGFIDAFRKLHPEAKGCYTYWSQRAGNRQPNKGLRLDYFICSPSLFDDSKQVVVRDSYILYDVVGSDHCPVVMELEIKKQ